jgi:predicted lipoprotein with Yx(FWY)xxD motif
MIKSKRLPFYVAGGAALSALAATLGLTLGNSNSSASTVTATPSSTVVQTRDTALGTILVDAQGRTLYLFAKDNGPASACVGSCASAWPPVPVAGTPGVSGAASAADLGVITGAGGARQLTYAGHPLYYFAGDSKPGQTNGQAISEFGAKWFVLNSSGVEVVQAPVVQAPVTSPSSANQPAGGGYGY